MWIAMKIRSKGTVRTSVFGQPYSEHEISFKNDKTGELGVLSVYKTKKQAIADNGKDVQLLQVDVVKK